MPRVAWSRVTVVLFAMGALALASCLQDVGDCPTCPDLNSGSIEVLLPQFGQLDSVQVRMDGGAQVSVRRNQRFAFQNLSPGTHEVTLVRWLVVEGVVVSRPSTLLIRLDRGETRIILFHNDFPLVAWAPSPDPGGRVPPAPRMG